MFGILEHNKMAILFKYGASILFLADTGFFGDVGGGIHDLSRSSGSRGGKADDGCLWFRDIGSGSWRKSGGLEWIVRTLSRW